MSLDTCPFLTKTLRLSSDAYQTGRDYISRLHSSWSGR